MKRDVQCRVNGRLACKGLARSPDDDEMAIRSPHHISRAYLLWGVVWLCLKVLLSKTLPKHQITETLLCP